MASISLAPTATFLHISASASSSFEATPGILAGRQAAPRALPLHARPPHRITVACSGAAATAAASDASLPVEKFRLDNLGPQKGLCWRPKRKRRGTEGHEPKSESFGGRAWILQPEMARRIGAEKHLGP
ncbi:50S ribosomal protein L15, chloroplastic [Sorghum bicolor]|uniref:50S ribosomal protein L15, chloroplastic n=1 Tax=Sorghum bicolor TaxID=4558 RepID=UPI000B425D20|nr:50S ribosomal protein L15, chloroplastic [Sorghum bicolor]|eukprot:XP_002447656.2 50S ribosomal protein L15, chloroplastic [Sorghum bicolor]